MIAIVGGPLLLWRVVTSHTQAQAARLQSDTAREAHYTSLFTTAVEQLGATREVKDAIDIKLTGSGKKREVVTITEPNLEVRLGAIYALERIAQDSERDHWPIMEVLSAYVRNPQNCGLPMKRPNDVYTESSFSEWRESVPNPRVDIQAALTVMGRRGSARIKDEKRRGLRIVLTGANLQRANLEECDLSDAYLMSCHLDFADFMEANLNRASLSKAHANGVVFVGTKLEKTIFYEASLDESMFPVANLVGTNFDKASLQAAWLQDAKFQGTTFFGADLSKAYGQYDARKAVFLPISTKELKGSMGDITTKLPSAIKRPKHWPDAEWTDADRGIFRDLVIGAEDAKDVIARRREFWENSRLAK
ncbi:MAG TPA: pentapeptide repeat-containing protein [Xanthobacteraceae bacterium]|nr:pentapeptide repeat-containing protein [Xanthobacteraceae bacterium]